MPRITIEEFMDPVQAVLNELYKPRVRVGKNGTLIISIGHTDKGTITYDELYKRTHSCRGFINLIKSKIE